MHSTLLALAIAALSRPVAIPVPSMAPDTLRGSVTDDAGRPLAGARVTIAELAVTATTGDNGAFAVAAPDGRYTVVIAHEGHESVSRLVRVDGTTVLSVSIEPAVFSHPPMSVTATRSPAEPRRSPLPVSMLSETQLRHEHGVSLAQAVSQLAGVHSVTTGEQIGKPVVRGLSGPRVLVLENGHRLEDYSWSDEDGPSVDARVEDRIEVVRGPASVLYGSDAIGGVINAMPSPLPSAAEGYGRGEAELYFATNNAEVGTALRYEGASGSIGWRALLVGRKGADLHTPAGELANTGFAAADGELVLGMHHSGGTSTLRYSRYGGEFKLLEAGGPIPGTGGEPEEEEGPERKLSDDRIQFDGNYALGGMRLETKGQWQRHFISELSDDLSQGGQKVETEVFNLVLSTFTGDVILHHAGDNGAGSIGVSASRQGNDTRGIVPLVPDATISSIAGFVFERFDAGRFSLLVGARAEHRSVDADANVELGLTDESRSYTVAVGNAGAVLRATDRLSFTANVGRAWRAPNLFEMFTNGPRLGEARYEVGKADLEPETSINFDGSIRWSGPRVRAEVSAYRNRIDQYIYVTPTNDEIDGLRVYRYLQDDATLAGAELAVEVDATQSLTLRGRFDSAKGTNDATDEPLPLIPARMGAVGADLHTTSLGWAEQAFIGLETEITAAKTRNAPAELATDGYTLLNLDAGLRHRFAGRDMRFDLRVRNLTNTDYRSFLSRYKEFAADPGRNLILRVSTAF